MVFKEALPAQCPPDGATDKAIREAYRLVKAAHPQGDDFASHAHLGKQRPEVVGECQWASCSLFTSLMHVKNMPSLPKLRAQGNRFVAKLSVPRGAGVSLCKGVHVDFWMYATFDPTAAVEAVEQI